MIEPMPTRPRGRPRDPAIDGAIRTAAQELIVEVGHRGLSMDAVAARAGVSKPTLYLRYPTKSALILDAVFGRTKSRALPGTGSLHADLLEAYTWAVLEFDAPEARAALPTLIAETSSSPELARLAYDEVIGPEYERVETLLRRAQARGEVREDADLVLAIDVLVGAALARATVLDRPLDPGFAERTITLVVDGLRPRP